MIDIKLWSQKMWASTNRKGKFMRLDSLHQPEIKIKISQEFSELIFTVLYGISAQNKGSIKIVSGHLILP